MKRNRAYLLAAFVLLIVAASRGRQDVSSAGRNWATYGGTLANQRYSTLSQIDRTNVSRLQTAWSIRVSSSQGSFECTPLVVDGVMYLTTGENRVYALKADTGERLWQYLPRINQSRLRLCCGLINRGVALNGDRVYIATVDARLIALDASTGQPVASFGTNGEVQIADPTKGYSETGAPVVADGKVLLGVAGGEFATRGFFSAYDAQTGQLLWRWHTIPAPDEPGGDTWPNNGAYLRGGGCPWMNAAVDEENGLVIFSTSNPNADLDGSNRAGDNLYTCSVVALDLRSGTLRWHFQEVKHDLWDYDQAAPPLLFDSVSNGQRVQAVGAAGKTGWFYILDRKTGKSLLPMREIAVPQNTRQATAPTQIVPEVPPFVEHRNIFTPPTTSGVWIAPGLNGGARWNPLAYSPETRLVYIGAVHKPMRFYGLGGTKPDAAGAAFGGGTDLEPGADPKSAFVAIDVNTGQVRWRTPVRPYPGGGQLATAGGLLFAGDARGMFNALNAETGELLWQFECVPVPDYNNRIYGGAPAINAAPMTYEVNGRQYVAQATGEGSGQLFVFALPQ